MKRRSVEIVVPPPGARYAAATAEPLAAFASLLARHRLDVVPRAWTDAAAGDADAALVLLAWGYHLDPAGWAAMLDRWPARTPLFNPPALLRWNGRKTYLAELAEAGVPTVPTQFVARADGDRVAAAFDAFATDEIVLKPQVSAGSDDTYRLRRGDTAPVLADAMIQPFLAAVAGEGELALFHIGGRFSHAACKRAAPDDFRVQPQFGGRIVAWEATDEAHHAAALAIAALPSPPLYVRIDLIRCADGRLAVMEVEAIEPDLYLDIAPEAADRLAQALNDALDAVQ